MISPKIENRIALTIIICCISIVVLFQHCETWFPSLCGSHSLGNNFYALDWEGGVQLVVYHSSPHGPAYGGIEFIRETPSAPNHGCVEIKHNKTHIAMKVIDKNTDKLYYFLYDKRCIANIPKDSISRADLIKGLVELNESQYIEQCRILDLK